MDKRAIKLTADPRSAARARAFVRAAIEDLVEEPDDAVLLTSELVVNVIRHVGTALVVEIDLGPPIRIAVTDGMPPSAELRALMERPVWPPATALSGRGLSLLHELADRVGLDALPAGAGKIVWFEI